MSSNNPLVEQFRRGGVAQDLRMMAAQGLLPLKLEDVLELLADLTRDPAEDVREAARASLLSLPGEEILPIARSKHTAERVLAWVAEHRPEPDLREAALQNPSLADESLEALAPTLPQALAELVVINQTRLLRRTSLLEAIESNPALNNDQKRRLTELRESFKVGVVITTPPSPAAPEPEVLEPELAPEVSHLVSVASVSHAEAERYIEICQIQREHASQRILHLSIPEKLIVALKGSCEERAILIRDPHPLVAAGALGSPRTTEGEVEAYSTMKNVSEQVLRDISNHRAWTRCYGVIKALVRNPRTPADIALRFVLRLTQRDLKALAADPSVSEAVRKAAEGLSKGAH